MLLTARHLFVRAAAVAAFACGLAATAAHALEARQVEVVVTVLEQLASETGNTVFYDEDAAEEWFEADDESSRLIPAAGFTRSTWKEAFDQTMTGFLASIPQAELERMMEDFMNEIGEVGRMTPQQKQEATDALRAEMGRFETIRERGAQHRGVVAPYGPRLRRISLRD